MFYHFSQNNSGGRFRVDLDRGITVDVIVEADTLEEAQARAEDIGLYWDGVSDGSDCECCGDRWSRPYGNLDPEPMLYGIPVLQHVHSSEFTQWVTQKGREVCIHFLNGEKVWL